MKDEPTHSFTYRKDGIKAMAKSLLVTIETRGRIPAIYADGPILVPTPLGSDLVKKLVMSNVKLYVHNPHNVQQKVKVTRSNMNDEFFPPVVPKPEPKPIGKDIPQVSFEKKPVVAPVVETPVVEETKTVEPVKEEDVEEAPVEETKEVAPQQSAPVTIDKYAGMSKNQRKRARQAEAAARAATAAQEKNETTV